MNRTVVKYTRMFCRVCNTLCVVALSLSLIAFVFNRGQAVPEDSRSLFFSEAVSSESAIPAVLSNRDVTLYQSIFRAQKKDDWKAANGYIKQLHSQVLMGYVLADRYLHHYHATQSELVSWLNKYSDHPQAPELYWMALAKTPAIKSKVPTITRHPYLEGYGDDNGLASIADNSPYISVWRSALQAWRMGNKAGAAKLFSSITRHGHELSPWTISAASYWSYRCYNAIGNHHEANRYLHLAADEPRSFYGILARRQLKEKLNLDGAPTNLTDADMLEMIGEPMIERTIALTQIGMNEMADRELRTVFLQSDNDEKLHLLALAHELGLASVQISMAKHVSADGALDYAKYPVPNWQPQGGFKVSPELIFALMRQESGFRASAMNPSGAMGLMQLMPETALLMQKNMTMNGVTLAGTAADPICNITLGQSYVKHLLDNELVEGNLFYLLAAYNAGPGRLQEWKHNLDYKSDPLLFIESIPIAQTRYYVMQVMTNYWIYNELADKPNNSISAVAHGHWPSYDETSYPVADATPINDAVE